MSEENNVAPSGNSNPLWMPTGSVRSIIALGVVAGYAYGLIAEIEMVMLVLGFYFGSRNGK
jgi:hypothetical protein